MNKTSCRTLPILCIALVVAFLVSMSGVATAQDVYKHQLLLQRDPLKVRPMHPSGYPTPEGHSGICAPWFTCTIMTNSSPNVADAIETPNGLRTFNSALTSTVTR